MKGNYEKGQVKYEQAELRKLTKGRDLKMEDSTRHAKDIRRATYEEFDQMSHTFYQDYLRYLLEIQRKQSHLYTMERMARQDVGTEKVAALNTDSHRSITSMTAKRGESVPVGSPVLKESEMTPDDHFYQHYETGDLAIPVNRAPFERKSAKDGSFLADIKKLPRKERVIESTGSGPAEPIAKYSDQKTSTGVELAKLRTEMKIRPHLGLKDSTRHARPMAPSPKKPYLEALVGSSARPKPASVAGRTDVGKQVDFKNDINRIGRIDGDRHTIETVGTATRKPRQQSLKDRITGKIRCWKHKLGLSYTRRLCVSAKL